MPGATRKGGSRGANQAEGAERPAVALCQLAQNRQAVELGSLPTTVDTAGRTWRWRPRPSTSPPNSARSRRPRPTRSVRLLRPKPWAAHVLAPPSRGTCSGDSARWAGRVTPEDFLRQFRAANPPRTCALHPHTTHPTERWGQPSRGGGLSRGPRERPQGHPHREEMAPLDELHPGDHSNRLTALPYYASTARRPEVKAADQRSFHMSTNDIRPRA
jgi:hypothetical protein